MGLDEFFGGGDKNGEGSILGTILAVSLPAAIAGLSSAYNARNTQDWEKEKWNMQAAENQKERDLKLLLQQMAGGGGGGGAAGVKERLLLDAMTAAARGRMDAAQIKGSALERYLASTQNPIMSVTGQR